MGQRGHGEGAVGVMAEAVVNCGVKIKVVIRLKGFSGVN